jgi:hypothetical protein
MGSVAVSHMRMGFLLIYEEMRKYLVIHVEAVSHVCLGNRPFLKFLIYEENFLSVAAAKIMFTGSSKHVRKDRKNKSNRTPAAAAGIVVGITPAKA